MIWRTPYRWRYKPLTNIRWIFGDILGGIRNVIRWTPVIWFDADFDWEYLAAIMEYKLRRMSKGFQESQITVGAEKHARQTMVCAALLRRLRDDKYFTEAGYNAARRDSLCNKERSRLAKESIEISRNDKRYLGLIMGKFLDHWWD